MGKVPSSRPQMTKADVEKIINHLGVDRKKFPVCVLAVRGYYRDSMGEKGKNDRGIFDDAAFVDTPNVFVSVNWNTDASSFRAGTGKGSEKGMAMLAEGVWDYRIGAHKGRSPAGVQAGPVTVNRDSNKGTYPDTGWFGINLHWGSASGGTSSLGCQTAPPDQFPTFINPIVAELKRYDVKVFKYILISEETRRDILTPISMIAEASSAPPAPNLAPALTLIKEFEGLYLKAYKDPVGIPTIGWGTIQYPDGRRVRMGDSCTVDEATVYLLHDLAGFVQDVKSLVRVPITNNMFCALVSFAYNVGADIDADDIAEGLGDSTLLRKLNAGASKVAVADEFLKWNKAGGKVLAGLVRRRKAERTLFLT